jgi:two-component system NtrC family response regulator
MQKKILVVEDENFQLALYSRILRAEGYIVHEAEDLNRAREIYKNNPLDVCIIDVRLPDGNGIDFVSELKENIPGAEIIVFTGTGTIMEGVKAIKNGAFDYIIKGESPDKILRLVALALKTVQRKQDKQNIELNRDFNGIIGESTPMKRIKAMGLKVAVTSANVLLLGETGVGKDVFAEAIHYSSKRSANRFVAINCSGIGRDTLESELFGYKAGAFTGAMRDKKGLFEEAHNGTIFLDEIGEMSLDLQAKILRVLENKSFIKVGDTKTTYVDSRLVAATHIDLLKAVKQGKFREDLYYRLCSFIIEIPPLRDREDDISLLMYHYIRKLSLTMGIGEPVVAPSFVNKLERHPWKGNVRELVNVLERALILSSGALTTDLIELLELNSEPGDLKSLERQYIDKILSDCFGNKRKAARVLGISIATLYRRLNADEASGF